MSSGIRMSVAFPSTVAPSVVRDVSGFARALMAAHRTRQMYAADHPTTRGATERFRVAAVALATLPELHIGVGPGTLYANGEALPADRRMAEAAALLHDRDIITLRVSAPPGETQIADLLHLLGLDPDRIRKQGGPARLWRDYGHEAINIVQVDYEAILAATAEPAPPPEPGNGASATALPPTPRQAVVPANDGIWTNLVQSFSGAGSPYTRGEREKLRQIAHSPEDISRLVTAAVAAEDNPDASKRRAAQAATVLTAFDRLVSEVESSDQAGVAHAIRSVATAATRLDPGLVMDAVSESAESGLGAAAVRAMGDAFDDEAIAKLLAASMAKEGRATGRMAAALTTLAPDPDRRQRVLRLAGSTAQQSAGRAGDDVASAWSTLEHILKGPADTLYTSSDYAFQLQETELRSHRLRLDTPKLIDDWLSSVSAESMRDLSVTLMLDLFAMEPTPIGLSETAQDLAHLAEEFLQGGDYAEAERIMQALAPPEAPADSFRANAARVALDHIARSGAMAEVASAAGDFDADQVQWFQAVCQRLGPAVLPSLLSVLGGAGDGPLRERLTDAIAAMGDAAIEAVSALLASEQWERCRTAIHVLGRIGGAAAVAALQPLVTGTDLRKMREAITVLIRLDDPAAQRLVAAALQHPDRRSRLFVISALAAAQDERATPLLASALGELHPFGPNFPVAMQILGALRRTSDDRAAAAVSRVMRSFSWMRWRESVAVRRTAVEVLASMPSRGATEALAAAARDGDYFLKRYARAAVRTGD